MNKSWVVYAHISPSGKTYIGITCNIKVRWSNKGYRYSTYNSIFRKAIEKYGWENIEHKILLENISKEEADYAERYLIKWYKLHKLSYNITDGGQGTLGRVCSDITKDKMRASAKGPSQNTIEGIRKSKKHKEQAAKNIVIARNAWKGRHHSDETISKLREMAKGRDMRVAVEASKLKSSKKVELTFPDGRIEVFNSISDAARVLNTSPANVSRSIRRNLNVKHCKSRYYVE